MRTVVAGLAAVASPALAKPTIAGKDDSKLLALVEEFIAAEREFRRLLDEQSRVENQVLGKARSAPSDILRVRPEDAELGLPKPFDSCLTRNASAEFYRSPDIDRLACAEWSLCEEVKLPAGVHAIASADDPIHRHLEPTSFLIADTKFTPGKEARARADEIVAALRAERRAEQAAIRKLGLRRAEREAGRACTRASRLADQIAETDAHTMAGIMAKVRCVAIHYKNQEITLDIGNGGDEMALSIASDLARLGGAQTAALAA